MVGADWRPHFESRGNYRATCRICRHDLDVRGNRPQDHLAEKHPGADSQPAPAMSHQKTEGAVALPGQAADPAPTEPARPSPPPTTPAAGPPAGRPDSKSSPDGSAPSPAATPPAGGSREELLEGLWRDSRDKNLTATERARARELIAKVEGYAEEKEADTEDLRLRHLDRVKKAMDAQQGADSETLRILTDPINGRAAREWLRDLLLKAEGTAA